MRQTNRYRENAENQDRLLSMRDALLCRLRGQTPQGVSRIYEWCHLSTFEVLLAAGTGDFPLLLGDLLDKRTLDHYALLNPTHVRLTKRISIKDFRPSRVLVVDFPQLRKTGEHSEFKVGMLGESGEDVLLETWGAIVGLSRAAILNDDARALDDIPLYAATAVATAIDDLFFTSLLSNSGTGPVMRDGYALFSAEHGNLMSGAALSATSLGVAIAALRNQRSLAGAVMNNEPRFLLVGPELEVIARSLLTSITPGATAPLELVVDAHITDGAFYIWADPQRRPAFVRGHLSENRAAPHMIARRGFSVDGIEFRCSADFAVGPADWRSVVRTPPSA